MPAIVGIVDQVERTVDDVSRKVIGNVVCSVKDEALVGIRLMLVERLYGGGTVVALDAVGSGPG
jgi:microcompartment protein CcmK/EutM